MSYGAGSLDIAARRVGTRTVLERVHYDGISRCSRAFRRGDAALVVLSQLGPGVVRGDTVASRGHVGGGAHLIVTNQTAMRLLGGPLTANSRASWVVADHAVLELVGEPLVANPGARYASLTEVDLGVNACVLLSEIVCVPADADMRLRTSVRRAGREIFYDALDAAAIAPYAVGMFACIGTSANVGALLAALDEAADRLVDVRSGVGSFSAGVFARVVATDIWSVRCALAALRVAAWEGIGAFNSVPTARPAMEKATTEHMPAVAAMTLR